MEPARAAETWLLAAHREARQAVQAATARASAALSQHELWYWASLALDLAPATATALARNPSQMPAAARNQWCQQTLRLQLQPL